RPRPHGARAPCGVPFFVVPPRRHCYAESGREHRKRWGRWGCQSDPRRLKAPRHIGGGSLSLHLRDVVRPGWPNNLSYCTGNHTIRGKYLICLEGPSCYVCTFLAPRLAVAPRLAAPPTDLRAGVRDTSAMFKL